MGNFGGIITGERSWSSKCSSCSSYFFV